MGKLALALGGVVGANGIHNLHFLEQKKLRKSSSHHKTNTKAFVTDKVFMNGKLIFCHDPDSLGVAGSKKEDQCYERQLGEEMNSIEVCGVAMQILVYSQHGCMDNANEVAKIGVCEAKLDSSACVKMTAPVSGAPGSEDNIWLKNALSYKIQVCPGMEVPTMAPAKETLDEADEEAEEEKGDKAQAEADQEKAVEDAGEENEPSGEGKGNAAAKSAEVALGAPGNSDEGADEAAAKAKAELADEPESQSPAEQETSQEESNKPMTRAEMRAAALAKEAEQDDGAPEEPVKDDSGEALAQPQPDGSENAEVQWHVQLANNVQHHAQKAAEHVTHHVQNVVAAVSSWFGGWR